MNLFTHKLHITEKEAMIKLSKYIKDDLKISGISDGIVLVYSPHTTTGITINENADPHVIMDLLYVYKKLIPAIDKNYLHKGNNSSAHIKSATMGNSVTLIAKDGNLILGKWQEVYFCDFDGPRDREFFIKIIEG